MTYITFYGPGMSEKNIFFASDFTKRRPAWRLRVEVAVERRLQISEVFHTTLQSDGGRNPARHHDRPDTSAHHIRLRQRQAEGVRDLDLHSFLHIFGYFRRVLLCEALQDDERNIFDWVGEIKKKTKIRDLYSNLNLGCILDEADYIDSAILSRIRPIRLFNYRNYDDNGVVKWSS